MTTVAWDGNTLATDRLMGDWVSVRKMFKLKDGRIAAGCGNSFDAIRAIVAWLDAGSPAESRPDIVQKDAPDLLLVSPEGATHWLSWPYANGVRIREPFFALGSGSEYALGAMAAGCSARQAVAIACRFDPGSGRGIDTVRIIKGSKP